MRAKKVYEFKRTRKQGLSDKTNIGIDQYAKIKIEEWINKFIPTHTYEIIDNNIIVYDTIRLSNNKELIWIPDNLSIKMGSLDISNTPIKKLPDNLEIDWNLDISNTDIDELPDDLIVKLDLRAINTKIKEWKNSNNSNWSVHFDNSLIISIPENVELEGVLSLRNNPISKLPENGKIKGTIYLEGTNITEIPENFRSIKNQEIVISEDMAKNFKKPKDKVITVVNKKGHKIKYL